MWGLSWKLFASNPFWKIVFREHSIIIYFMTFRSCLFHTPSVLILLLSGNLLPPIYKPNLQKLDISIHHLCRKIEDFHLCTTVHPADYVVNLLHDLIFNKIFAAIAALHHRQILNDDNGVNISFKRKICNDLHQIVSARVAIHSILLVLPLDSHLSLDGL